MTSKLTITDERIEKIAVWLATESHSLNLEMLTCLRELQKRRKAAMDSEPVAHQPELANYPPAQPAPNFEKLARELVENLVDCGGLDVGVKGKYLKWTEKTCRAAMLAAAPQEVK